MYSVLNTLSEYTYFYILENIISYNFFLVFKMVESLQCILKKIAGSATRVLLRFLRNFSEELFCRTPFNCCFSIKNTTGIQPVNVNIMTKENHILIFSDVVLYLHLLLWLEPATELKYQKPEAHSEPRQTSEMEPFAEIVNSVLCPP